MRVCIIAVVAMLGFMVACQKADAPKTAEAATPADAAVPGEPAAAPEPATPAAPAERLTGPVAKVNDVPIDSSTFYAELDKITSRGAKIPADRLVRIEQNILKRLVEKELIRQAIAKAEVSINDAEVGVAFGEYKKRFQTDEQFDNYLKHGKVTIDAIKDRIKQKKLLEKLVASRGSLEVTDEEGKEFYNKNERFYLEKAGVQASHVLVKLTEKAGPDQEKAAMDKIKQVQAKLKKGKDFAEVAKEYSEGPTAPKGGDLGFFGRGQMVKAFEDRAFAMKEGEVSGPVRTKFGFHIIKVTGQREERKKPYGEVKEQIVQTLKNKRFFQERRKLLDELRDQAKVDKMLPEPKAAPTKTASPTPIKVVPSAPSAPSKAPANPNPQ